MGEQRQSATYLTFKGGLNTEASDLNTPSEDAVEMTNILLTSAGTVRRRKGMDFFPNLSSTSSTLYTADNTDYTVDTGNYVDPAPSGISFTVQLSTGELKRFWTSVLGRYIYVYDQDGLPQLTDMNQYHQRIPLPSGYSAKVAHYKTRFVKDSNRIYLLSPHLPLSYLTYDESIFGFQYETEQVFYRDTESSTDPDSRVTTGGNTYRCILSHIADSTNTPGSGAQWKDNWVLEGQSTATGAPAAWVAATAGNYSVSVLTEASSVSRSSSSTAGASTVYTYDEYVCIASHTSNSATAPPNATYWKKVRTISTSSTSYNVSLGQGRGPRWSSHVLGVAYTTVLSYTYQSNIKERHFTGSSYPQGYNCGTMAAGRLWLSGSLTDTNTINFSQSVIKDENYSRAYAWADPYNPDDPDIVTTDGGSLRITSAEKIVGLADYRGGILVLATNGIWYVSGSDLYFKADNYSIQKITDDGCMGRFAWEYVEDQIIYCGVSGISLITLDQVAGTPTVKPISTKIKSFWTGIPRNHREACEVVYNPDTFQLVIAMNFTTPSWYGERNIYNQPTRMSDFLIWDARFNSWYKYQIAADVDGSRWAVGGIMTITGNFDDSRIVTANQVTVTSSGSIVTVPTAQKSKQTSTGLLLIRKSNSQVWFSLGVLEGDAFDDFSKTTSSDSELVTGKIRSAPQLFSDIGHRKQVPYLHTAFERVETGFDSATLTFTNPGGCLYRILWDWVTDTTAGIKYGQPFQAYRPNKYNMVYDNGVLYGQTVVKNKHRIRGSGRVVSFQFEIDGSNDFHLLGWQADVSAFKEV